MAQKNNERKGLWIPIEIMELENLDFTNQALLSEIRALHTLENGCIASNGHFSTILKVGPTSVSKRITRLTELGYINTQNIYKNNKCIGRKITPLKLKSNENAEEGIAPEQDGNLPKNESSAPKQVGAASQKEDIAPKQKSIALQQGDIAPEQGSLALEQPNNTTINSFINTYKKSKYNSDNYSSINEKKNLDIPVGEESSFSLSDNEKRKSTPTPNVGGTPTKNEIVKEISKQVAPTRNLNSIPKTINGHTGKEIKYVRTDVYAFQDEYDTFNQLIKENGEYQGKKRIEDLFEILRAFQKYFTEEFGKEIWERIKNDQVIQIRFLNQPELTLKLVHMYQNAVILYHRLESKEMAK